MSMIYTFYINLLRTPHNINTKWFLVKTAVHHHHIADEHLLSVDLNLIYFGSNKSVSCATTNKQSQTKKFPLSQIEFDPFVTMASVSFPLYLVAMASLPFLYACIFLVLSGGFFVAMRIVHLPLILSNS